MMNKIPYNAEKKKLLNFCVYSMYLLLVYDNPLDIICYELVYYIVS